MQSDNSTPTSIDAYIAGFPAEVQTILERIRTIIRTTAPDAQETIKYQLPTFILYGNLVHFGAFKNHIGLYPLPSGITAFQDELAPYANAKGSIRFPLNQPIPFELINKIILFRIQENRAKAATKQPAKRKDPGA